MKRLFSKKYILPVLLVLVLVGTSLTNLTIFAAKKDKQSPTTPTNLKATVVMDTSITLNWDVSTDNVGVKSYNIYKSGVLIGNTTTNTYTVSGLTSKSTYKFYVKALDTSGNISKSSKTLTVTTKSTISTATPTVTPTVKPTIKPTVTPTQTASPAVTNTEKIVGYYAAWAAYSGYTPDKIDVSKLTHINYAFANVGSDLKIALGYPDVDVANFNKLKALKQINPNLKTMISVGGWSWSKRFSDVALTDASRTTFATSCVDFIVKYGFDGVDIDWEYPVGGGLSTNVNRPQDKENFTLLMQKLRQKLDERGKIDGKHYILTFAGASSNTYLNNTEMSKLHQYVDYANVMTYDLHGMWDSYTDLTAPLYSNSDTSPQYKSSVNDSIQAWIVAGFPKEKIIMGVPFYGYVYQAVANTNRGLYQTYSGSASISYQNIKGNYLNKTGFTRYFHSESMSPWLFNGSTFISYEDEQSIGIKADYIKSKGLGGAMVWELSQDPSGVLLDTLYNGLQ